MNLEPLQTLALALLFAGLGVWASRHALQQTLAPPRPMPGPALRSIPVPVRSARASSRRPRGTRR